MAQPTIEELLKKLEERDQVIAQLRAENDLLRQKVDKLSRMIYGTKSEPFNPNQPDFFELVPAPQQESGTFQEKPNHERKKKSKRSTGIPENLPVEETVIDPLEVQAEPEAYKHIGDEVSEQLDYTPGAFRKVRTVRRKYVRKNTVDAKPVIAPLPPKLQDGCMAAPGLLATIVVSRYVDHLPFYRQESIFKTRHGIFIPRQNMARWVEMVADRLEPIYNILKQGVLGGDYLQMDETPVRYLSPGVGKAMLGYMWVTTRPGSDAIFHWETSRSAQCVKDILNKDFEGILQTDAYAAYGSFAKDRPKVTMAGCLAHVRRKFYEAFEQDPVLGNFMLSHIGELYDVERSLRKRRAGPALRKAERNWVSRPILSRMRKALEIMKPKFLPQSNAGKAIRYALGVWNSLLVYLDDGRVEIDNNHTENAIRPTAVGKKNWLFIGAAEAGKKAAILYTIVESCRRLHIDPYAYLKDVLTRLPSTTNHTVSALTPENWAKARSSSKVDLRAAA
jgi:transposase